MEAVASVILTLIIAGALIIALVGVLTKDKSNDLR